MLHTESERKESIFSGNHTEKYDVTALGELLIDFTEHDLEQLTETDLNQMLTFANAAA